jgi:GTP-binding nuclear protein Ran
MNEFKLLLIGDGGVGKTSFVRRFVTGEFDDRYVVTHAQEISPITFQTSRGPIVFNVHDTSGQECHVAPLLEHYYKNTKCVVLMFDLECQATYEDAKTMYGFIEQYWRNNNESKKPVVLVGNKADSIHRKVHFHRVRLHLKPSNRDHMVYFETSARRGTNLMDPFVWLAQYLCGDHNLALTLVRPQQPEAIDDEEMEML